MRVEDEGVRCEGGKVRVGIERCPGGVGRVHIFLQQVWMSV